MPDTGGGGKVVKNLAEDLDGCDVGLLMSSVKGSKDAGFDENLEVKGLEVYPLDKIQERQA